MDIRIVIVNVFSPSPKFEDIFTCHWISLSRVSNANTTVTSWQMIAIVLDSLSNVNPVNGVIVVHICLYIKQFDETTYQILHPRSVVKIMKPLSGRACTGLCCLGTVANVNSLKIYKIKVLKPYY